ncbi:MAG TPA: hypothetical protein VD860_05775 [Azospirillum sp.]|nr:hypothetical protein [Azospirillum sp.]
MLFLRDIQVDIQMRCRGCGHEGVLARPDLERRFGPNYPVLSIAPHYRCSRCNSKDVESGPAPNASSAFTAAPATPEDFGGALGALQGLLDSVRGQPEPAAQAPRDDVQDLMGDDLLDTMVEEPEEDAAPPPPQAPSIIETREEPEADEFDELFAKLVAARAQDDGKDEEEPEPAPPLPPAPADSPFDETLAALRALTAEPEAEDDETDEPTDEPPLYDETAEALDEALDALDEPPEDLDDIPDEEILSFAIRDPDARAAPEPLDEEPEEPEEEEEDEPDDGEPLDLAAYRRPPPEHGSLDESLAALRALVEKAAEEPEPEPKKKPRTRAPIVEDEPAEEPPPPPVKTAQEKSLEETLAQLRGMLDLDKDPGEEGEPVIKPRRR